MIHVIAIITAKPGQRENVLAAARANIPAVLAEDGCIEYAPAIDAEGLGSFQTKVGPDAFVFIEKWTSVEAHKNAGSQIPKDVFAPVMATLDGPPEGAYLDYLKTV